MSGEIQSSAILNDANEANIANSKYKKALKQINKLIGINTSVKKQLVTLQEQYDALQNDYISLQEKYTKIASVPIIHNSFRDDGKMKRSRTMGNNNKLRENDEQECSPNSRGKELQNTGCLSQYVDTKRKLEQVEIKLLQQEKRITELTAQLSSKNQEISSLQSKHLELQNSLKQQHYQQISQITAQFQSKSVIFQTELSKYKQLNQKLEKQIQTLKQNSTTITTMTIPLPLPLPNLTSSYQSNSSVQNTLRQTKSIHFGSPQIKPTFVPYHQSFYTSQNTAHNSPHKSKQYQLSRSGQDVVKGDLSVISESKNKKIKDLEAEIQKIKKQNSSKRQKYKNQISKLKEEAQEKEAYIQQINQFMSKQQTFIESMYAKDSQNNIKLGKLSYPKFEPYHILAQNELTKSVKSVQNIPGGPFGMKYEFEIVNNDGLQSRFQNFGRKY